MLTYIAMQISKIISDVVSSKLGVPSDRFYLSVSLCYGLLQPTTHSLSGLPFQVESPGKIEALGLYPCSHVEVSSFVACTP